MSYQSLTIVGNVGKDAELKYTASGIAVANFSVAVLEKTGTGENRTEKTTWFDVALWRERGEKLAQYIRKGDKIMVIGKVSASTYLDKAGQTRVSLTIDADQIDLIGKVQSRDNGNGNRPSAQELETPLPSETMDF